MTDTNAKNEALEAGLQVYCPHCRQWHVVEQRYAKDSTAERGYAYVSCVKGQYVVGQIGHESRWPVSIPDPASIAGP